MMIFHKCLSTCQVQLSRRLRIEAGIGGERHGQAPGQCPSYSLLSFIFIWPVCPSYSLLSSSSCHIAHHPALDLTLVISMMMIVWLMLIFIDSIYLKQHGRAIVVRISMRMVMLTLVRIAIMQVQVFWSDESVVEKPLLWGSNHGVWKNWSPYKLHLFSLVVTLSACLILWEFREDQLLEKHLQMLLHWVRSN